MTDRTRRQIDFNQTRLTGGRFLQRTQPHAGRMDNTPHRLEAFSDGVLAIAITLLVLEIRPPQLHGSTSLTTALMAMTPRIGTTVMSFWLIGCYWVNHHHFLKRLRSVDHGFLLLSLLWLLFVCLMPFPTEILGDHFHDPANVRPAITLYLISLFLPAATWSLIWFYASKRSLLHEDSIGGTHEGKMYLVSTGLHLGLVLLSFRFAWLALYLGVALAVMYLFPISKTNE